MVAESAAASALFSADRAHRAQRARAECGIGAPLSGIGGRSVKVHGGFVPCPSEWNTHEMSRALGLDQSGPSAGRHAQRSALRTRFDTLHTMVCVGSNI